MITADTKQSKVRELIRLRDEYRNSKQTFSNQYDVLIQYFYQTQRRPSSLGVNQNYQGEFLNDGSITDNFGAYCAKMLTSAEMGSVWKGEKGTVKIVPSKNLPLDKEIQAYFVRISDDFSSALESKKSRFEVGLSTAIHEKNIFGTAGLACQRGDYSNPLVFQQRSVLNFCLGYDKDGRVDSIMFDRYDSAKQIVDKYGVSKVPKSVKEAYEKSDNRTKFVVTEFICPRKDPIVTEGKLGMPFAVYEFMPNDNKFLGEGGYESFPVPILFGLKLEYEDYGRSYAMDALPTVVQLNVASEILAEGGEATARPPLGMYDNGSLAGKTLDLSGGALNVFNVSGSVPTEKPIFPLYDVGDLRVMFEWQQKLYEKIMQFFLLDKIYDFGSQQRMSVPEVGIRDAIRSDATSLNYVNDQNFMVELFERGIDIMFSMGLLGVADPNNLKDPKVRELLKNGRVPFQIPAKVLDAMTRGLDWYDFEFISPAARTMRTEALRASTTFLQLIGEASALIPEFRDAINVQGTSAKLRDLLSADLVMINPPEVVAKIQQQRAQMQAAAMQMEAQQAQAKANQSNAQAMAAQTGAMRNLQGAPQAA